MTNWLHSGHLMLTLAPGEGIDRVPAHLDVLAGAALGSPRLTGGRLDRAIQSAAGGFRVASVYHARRNLGRVGSRGIGFDEDEERLGMSRTYRLEVAEPEAAELAVHRLRDFDIVQSVSIERLATTGTLTELIVAPVSADEIAAPHSMVHSREASQIEPGDERVTVAVIDTGVSLGHAELQRRQLVGYDVVRLGAGQVNDDACLVGDSSGEDFSPSDDVGHGSHVAGVIGAQGWQIPPGVAGRCLLLPIRVLAAARLSGVPGVTGIGANGDITAGLKIAADLGADVANLSFGTPSNALDPDAPPPYQAAVEYARQQGCVLVAAAGNSGQREIFEPAGDPSVIAVGSVDASGRHSDFSTMGDHIALSAPGERVVGVGRRGYRIATGTSHATPFVTGAVALLVAQARRRGQALTGAQARAVLTRSAQRSHSPSGEVGAGVLDIAAALRLHDRELSLCPAPQGDDHD
jgi:subtilisin family serine protease